MNIKYILIVMVCFLVGCIPEKTERYDNTSNNTQGITIPLGFPVVLSGEDSSVSNSHLSLSDISLQIIVFKKSGSDYLYSYVVDSFSEYNDSCLTVQLEKTESLVKLMLLAYADDSSSSWVEGVTSLADIRTSLIKDLGVDGKWDVEETIPLWGESEDFIVSGNNKTLNEVVLLRMFSAIQVLVSDQIKKEDFELTDVRLYNAHTKGLVIPDPDNLTNEGKTVSLPTLLSSSDAAYIELGTNLTENYLPTIYVCEAGIVNNNPDRMKVPFLLLGGKYKGELETTWYRVDFVAETDDDNYRYRHLLRNKLNRITVTAIINRGDEDEDEAIDKEKAEIDVSVTEWDTVDGALLLYGHNVLTVSRNNLTLSKDANELVQVTVFTDYYAGWTAKVQDSAKEWLTLVSPDPDGAGIVKGEPNVQTSLGFKVIENNTSSPREGIIEISLEDRLTLELKIIQQDSEVSLNVKSGGNTVTELVFASNIYQRNVAAQTLNIDWLPNGEICMVVLTEGSDAFQFDDSGVVFSPAEAYILNGGSETLTICPVPFTTEELAADPYKERVSTIDFVVSSNDSYRKHTVVLRHINYHLEVGELAAHYQIGKTYEIDVLTNVDDWEIMVVDNQGAFKTGNGSGNRAVYPDKNRNVITVTMSEDTRKADWMGGFMVSSTKAGKVYGVGGMIPIEMRAYYPFPNCYMIKPGESIEISVTNIQAFWREWLDGQIVRDNVNGSSATLTFEVLWQTIPQNVISPIPDLDIQWTGSTNSVTDYRNKRFTVQVSGSSPNGSVILAARHNGKIVWSWHLWITDYDPETENVRYTHSGNTNIIFMDRNLGAIANVANNVSSTGHYYQWGRKDPLPGPASYSQGNSSSRIRSIYNGQGVEITDRDATYLAESGVDSKVNLERTVTDPLIFMRNETIDPQDWYSTSDQQRNDYLWIDVEGEKTIFDPCPEGWRVPYFKNGRSPWFNISSVNSSNNVYNWVGEVGWFATTGFRKESGHFNSLPFLHTWMAETTGSRARGFRAANGINGTNSGYARSIAMAIRCIKDDE